MVWIAGGLVDEDARLLLWMLALAIDYGAPAVGFVLPRLGRTAMSDWSLSPAHLAERCQLVVIIALGESILVTGQTFADLEQSTATVAAFITAFLGSAALWWLYFARHARATLERIASSGDPARLGRGGYAYAHAVMVAGVIVTAVGDELVIAHPTGHVATATALCVLGGAALFAAGMVLFLISTGGLDHAERVMTALWFAAVAVLGLAAAQASPLTLAIVTTALLYALVAGAAWHARQEGEPVPLEEAI